MRILAAALGMALAFGVAVVPADACGDKLLVIGRRVKRVPQARHPASVLLYMRTGSALPTAAKEMHLETTLRRAGHSVAAVDREDRLRVQLGTGRYDFVLTDLPDAPSVAREASTAPGAPEVVPVASDVEEAALKNSRETYPVVIKAEKGRSYLAALDAAMQHRLER